MAVSCWLQTGKDLPMEDRQTAYTLCSGSKQIRLKSPTHSHTALTRHLIVIKKCTDPTCPECGEEKEISYNFLGRCSVMMVSK